MNTSANHVRGWLAALVAVVIVVLCGCEKAAGPVKPSTQPQGASEEHFGPGAVTAPVQMIVAKAQAAKPTKTLGKDASCVTAECHTTLATARQIHGPVSEKSCYSCHQEDIGGHKFPLARQGNATCTFCHAVSGTMSHQHKAIEQGCTSCHQPHVSNAKFLLKADSVEQLCAKCHQTPLKKFAHEPFAKGDCSSCHQAHQSENAMLLRGGEKSAHCLTCHKDMKLKLTNVAHAHKPAKEDCVACHSPHSTEFKHQLKEQQSDGCFDCHKGLKAKIKNAPVQHAALKVGEQCANCHDPHGSNEKSLLLARTDSVCLKCHDKAMTATDGHAIPNMKPTLTQSKFLHGPNRAGNCSACHDPHGAKQPLLLERAFPKTFYTKFDVAKYELCFTCHEKSLVLTAKTTTLTNFRDGDKNLHFMHVNRDEKGRSCKTCHNVHGSDLPNHLASEVPFEGSKWAMPMQFEQTTDGGKCSPGCHKERTYKRLGPATSQPVAGGVS